MNAFKAGRIDVDRSGYDGISLVTCIVLLYFEFIY